MQICRKDKLSVQDKGSCGSPSLWGDQMTSGDLSPALRDLPEDTDHLEYFPVMCEWLSCRVKTGLQGSDPAFTTQNSSRRLKGIRSQLNSKDHVDNWV